MKKNYLKLFTLIALFPLAVFAQNPTIHSTTDKAYNNDGSLAYTVDYTTVATSTGVTLTVNFTAETSDIEEIYDIGIMRDTDARLKDRVRIAKGLQVPANGTYVFVDEFATWTDDAGSPTGYTGSGAYPVGTPQFYSIQISRLPESGGTARTKRSIAAIYLPDAPDEVVSDVLNDDMTLVTRVYPNADDSSVILACDFAPNYDYFQQVLLAADPSNPLYPAGDKLVYYQSIKIDSDDDPAGRVDTGNSNFYWGTEGTTYYKLDIAPEHIGTNGYAYLWMTGGRPGHSTVTPIPVKLGEGEVEEEEVPTIHSTTDKAYNNDGSLAYTVDYTTVATSTGVTLTVNFTAETSDIEEIYDIGIMRDTDARLKDRVRIAKGLQVPANGTYVFVDEFATWTDDAGSPTGYTGSGAYPVGTPQFYSIQISRLPESGGTARTKRSIAAIYLPDAPDEVVSDVLNDDMTLVTRVYPNPDDSSVILACDFAPNYDYFQQVLLAADPSNPLYPAGDKLVYYQSIKIDSDDDPAGRVDTGNSNFYWGTEGTTYYKLDIAPENVGTNGYAYLWMTGGRPGHSTVTPIPVHMGDDLSTGAIDVSAVKMYPNPSNGIVNVEGIEGIAQVKLMNVAGQILLSKDVDGADSVSFDVSNVPAGLYLVALETENGQFIKKLLVK